MKRKLVVGALLLVLGVFFGVLMYSLGFHSGAKSKEEASKADPKTSQKVENPSQNTDVISLDGSVRKNIVLGKVESKPLIRTFKTSAEVSEDLKKFAKVHLKISGTVKEIYAWLGNKVDQGTPLLAISSTELEDAVEAYLTAKARYGTAKENYERTKKLRVEGIVSEKAHLENKKEYLTSKAEVERSREKLVFIGFGDQDFKEIESGKQEVSTYTVRSPISGVIVKQDGAILGATVSPDVELYQVLNSGSVWVFADIPPEIARKLNEGMTGKILIPGDKSKEGKITYISKIVDEKTRTVKVRLEAENTDNALRPGEFVEVEFQVPVEGTALVVPKTAVFLLEDKYVVFVPKETGFVPKEVKIGKETDGLLEIKEGLMSGNRIVTDGGYYIKSAMLKQKTGTED